MAELADTAEQVKDHATLDDGSDAREPQPADSVEPVTKQIAKQQLSGVLAFITAGIAVLALAVTAGWLGYRAYEARATQTQHNLFLQVARQAAVNLTTISYTEVDKDIQRILDSATGAFRDDFQQRSQPFVEVVKQVQSKSEGTVSEAGFLTEARDRAQVLLAVSVKTATAVAPEQEPRRWRLRIDVEKTNDGARVSNVEFVP
jgi:Mce-associated membrane protein